MMLPDEMIQEIARKHYMPTGNDMLDFAREVIAANDAKNNMPPPKILGATTSRLRAMAFYYSSGNKWSHIDAKTCHDAAYEIEYLRLNQSSDGKDVARLDWVINHGVGFRQEPKVDYSGEWYLVAPYYTGISCIDGVHRFKSARDAVDAAMTLENIKK